MNGGFIRVLLDRRLETLSNKWAALSEPTSDGELKATTSELQIGQLGFMNGLKVQVPGRPCLLQELRSWFGSQRGRGEG